MNVDVVDGFAMSRFTLTLSPSPISAGEGSTEPSVEALHRDQRLSALEHAESGEANDTPG